MGGGVFKGIFMLNGYTHKFIYNFSSLQTMHEWVHKKGYSTQLLADNNDMSSDGVQIQLVRFKEGKNEHYHKKKTEFFYFLKDGGSITIDGEKHMIKKGMTCTIKPNQVHAFDAEDSDYIEALNVKTNHGNDDTYSE